MHEPAHLSRPPIAAIRLIVIGGAQSSSHSAATDAKLLDLGEG